MEFLPSFASSYLFGGGLFHSQPSRKSNAGGARDVQRRHCTNYKIPATPRKDYGEKFSEPPDILVRFSDNIPLAEASAAAKTLMAVRL